ncbi:MAG: Helix-turn-helix transcriptional regulator [Mycobacterium sp.]|jgi:hypothetical protein|nr:Helix-turn-helix transcriptional regulator [Mycobacterium sp.]
MATIDDFSRLISGIYSSGHGPELWDVTMADIGRAFDGSRTNSVGHHRRE